MDMMVGDRKVWTAVETHALITLKEEMKSKFQTMKRNRTLWVELSDKLRQDFGHERTPAQCAVRWKNIMSAYKDSRDALRNSRSDSKVCSFFKELEAILGDPPLPLPVTDDAQIRGLPSPPPPSQSPRKRERFREQKDANITSLLAELVAKVDAQGAAIARIERMLSKAGIVSSPPATDILASAEPISVSLPDTATVPASGTGKPYGTGDTDVLLERPASTSVPELTVTADVPPQPDLNDGAQMHGVARRNGATAAHSLPSVERLTQEVSVTNANGAGDRADEVVAAEGVTVPVSRIDTPVASESMSRSPVPTAAGISVARGTVASGEVGCQGPTGSSRPEALTAIEPDVTPITNPSNVHAGVGESVGGSTDADIVNGGFEKDSDKQGPTLKKQKLVHTYQSAS